MPPATLIPLQAHYFVDDRAPWCPEIDDGLPCFGGETGDVMVPTHPAS